MSALIFLDNMIHNISSLSFENSIIKNRILQDDSDSYIGFVAENDCNVLLAKKLECYLGEEDIVVIVDGDMDECGDMSFEEVLQSFYMNITGIGFRKHLLKVTGCFNEKLNEATNYELLVRLTREKGKCLCVIRDLPSESNTVECSYAEMSRTYAYILRRYIKEIQTSGWFDSLFTAMYGEMNLYGAGNVFAGHMEAYLKDSEDYYEIERNTAPYLIVKGDDICAGVLYNFAIQLGETLTNIGQAVEWLDDKYVDKKIYKGCIGFQAPVLFDKVIRDINAKKYQFWFDYPSNFREMLEGLPDDYYMLCQDSYHAEFMKKHYGISNAIQFPPAGDMVRDYQDEKERVYDVAFIGAYTWEEYTVSEDEKEYYDYMISHPDMSYDEGYIEFYEKKYGVSPDSNMIINAMKDMSKVRHCIAAYYRHKVVQTILTAGIELHVYGDTWKNYSGEGCENLIVHPQISPVDIPDELSKAKIGLNIMRWHKGGMTERVANIMLAGAVCLTDETTYLKEHFEDDIDIEMFRLDTLNQIPKKINRLLSDDAFRRRIAENGKKRALLEHTWDVRAKQLVELV